MLDGLRFLCLMVGILAVMVLTGLAIGGLFAAIAAPFVLLIKWVF